MAKRKKKGPTPEQWARWRENEERLERVIQRRLREEDPEGAARREALFRASRGPGPEAWAARRTLWRETEERMERILDRIRAEEADRGTAAGELGQS